MALASSAPQGIKELLYPVVDKKEWIDTYNISPKEFVCPNCNAIVIADQPFAIKGYRGFIAKEHNCKKSFTPKTMVPVGRDKIEYWLKVKSQVLG